MVHLHTRSAYSLLESPFRIEQIVDMAIKYSFNHACLTDKRSMYGTMKFIKLCQEKGIHPIVGLEVDSVYQDQPFDFILLAKNDRGLQDLYALSTILMNDPSKISLELLFKYVLDCIVLTAGDDDSLEQYIDNDELEKLEQILKYCHEHIPDFYVSIAMNDSKYRANKNVILKRVAHDCGCRTVALSRIFYAFKEDVEKQRILKAIDKQTTIHDQTLNVLYDRYYRSQEEMNALYDKDDLNATEEIAEKCNIQLAMRKSHLPHFENKLGIDSQTYLIKLCKKGLLKRLNNHLTEEYVRRLEYELSVINSMGFTDYFLIVWDFIRYARSQDIYVGPGRGSAAGSLVAYCLGITHIDPIKNHLLFERFLNPDRVSMPDIDTDFPDDRRDEVIQYVKEKYGAGHVSHIVTFNTLKAKQVLRDVARVIAMPIRKVDELCKLIGNAPNMTLQMAYQQIPAFKRMIDTDKKDQELFELCLPLEGLPRHISVHAAGVVLSDQDIEKVCPLVRIDEENTATQFTQEYLEDLGLIKMDFLGLRNLTTIYQIINTLKQHHIDIDIMKLPLNDAKTYQLLSKGDTIGVFQLESEGIKNLLRKMKPSKFEDISAVLALYRPGAMQNIDEYIKRKNDASLIEYPHEKLIPYLKETYGLMIYQEQVMQCAQVIGGFTLAQADNLRKAMSKKKVEIMQSYKEQFIQGALNNKVSYKQAGELFDSMERFGGYGFNKSHSYAYGLISYQMAYLKANYPLFFYQRLLDSVIGSEVKTAQYIYECQHRGIKILPCDVNHSQASYTIENDALRMPLQVMKGIGRSIYPIILKERTKGEFKDGIDFVVRVSAAGLGESSLRILIDGGALDGFEYNRATWNENLSKILDYARLVRVEEKNQVLFDFTVVSRPSILKIKENTLLKAQREHHILGFYLSEHPVQTLRKKYPKCIPISQLQEKMDYVQVIGRVASFRTHKTKRQDMMCFMNIEDECGKIDVAVMPSLYDQNKLKIERNQIVIVQGKKDRDMSILARRLEWVDSDN